MAEIVKSEFGKLPDGRTVYAYTMKDGENKLTVLNYGGILQSLIVPDRAGKPTDVLLGYDGIEGYLHNGGYLGALIGRFGNRIDKGRLTVDGKTYQLYINDRSNHLHGGREGFNAKIWDVETEGGKLVLSCFSPDGEENYPGNLRVKVTYTFENGVLGIDYCALSDKATAVNLTNHAYFNLNGEGSGSILGHCLRIDSDRIVPTDDELIPHGGFRAVKGTPFDFTAEKKIADGDALRGEDEDLARGGGFDHCFVLRADRDKNKPYASLYSPESGIRMDCFTDMPAVQFYAGTGLAQDGKKGHRYTRCCGMCLETEDVPNNVNVPEYAALGSSLVGANQPYRRFARYAFSVSE